MGLKNLGEVVAELERSFKWIRDWRPTEHRPYLVTTCPHISGADLERLCAAFRAGEKMRGAASPDCDDIDLRDMETAMRAWHAAGGGKGRP